MALQLLRESYTGFSESTTIDTRLDRVLNALLSIEVTLWGIVSDVRLKQLLKAFIPIDDTLKFSLS